MKEIMNLRKFYTLIFVKENSKVLLGYKKRGFGAGKWNGFGGKLEPGESLIDAAIRELKEECGLKVLSENLKNIGHLEFTFEGEPQLMEVAVFSTTKYEGTLSESEEMKPKWFDTNIIPFNEMWLDDSLWFPYMLADKFFHGKFHYRGHNEILNYNITELKTMKNFYENKCPYFNK